MRQMKVPHHEVHRTNFPCCPVCNIVQGYNAKIITDTMTGYVYAHPNPAQSPPSCIQPSVSAPGSHNRVVAIVRVTRWIILLLCRHIGYIIY